MSKAYPIQKSRKLPRESSTVSEEVYMAAYEVYCEIWTPQPALIDLEGKNCRGGFCVNELVCFLYVRQFPKSEWRERFRALGPDEVNL